MTPRLCSRCRSTLHTEDAGSVVYCWSCGMPQIRLSEELRDQLAQQLLAAQNPEAAASAVPDEPVTDPAAVLWSSAVQLAGLTGAVFLVLLLASGVLAPVALLALFWMIGAPIVVLGVYCARNPRTVVTTAFGAQLGLLSGMAIAIVASVLNTVIMLLNRFAFHQGAAFDANLNTLLANLRTQTLAQAGAQADLAGMTSMLDMLNVPEFRIGWLLLGTAMMFGLYMLYTMVAGAFSGFLRSRARPR